MPVTKPKPRWVSLCGWLLVGLCALPVALPARAAESRAVTKPAAPVAKAKKQSSGKKKSSKQRARQRSAVPVVAAVDEGIGLFGAASYYGGGFHGRLTASGERFDKHDMTAASNRFPLGTWVAVRRESDGRCVVVRINDRMHPRHRIRVIDLSRGAAEQLRMISAGVVMVRVASLPGRPDGDTQAVCEQVFFAESVKPCPECNDAAPTWLPEASEAVEAAFP